MFSVLTIQGHWFFPLFSVDTFETFGQLPVADFRLLPWCKFRLFGCLHGLTSPELLAAVLRLSPLWFRRYVGRGAGAGVFQSLLSLLIALPTELKAILKQIRTGKLKVEIEHHGLGLMMDKLDSVGNRLSLSLMAAALIIEYSPLTL